MDRTFVSQLWELTARGIRRGTECFWEPWKTVFKLVRR